MQFPLSRPLLPPRPPSPSLKDLHFEVCKAEGKTDEEIAQDWEICEKELREQYLTVAEGVPPEEPKEG